jgi:hypothetical protein
MNWIVTIYCAILFFVLTPKILVSLPPKSSKMVVAATHAVIFAIIFHFTYKIVYTNTMNLGLLFMGKEGFEEKKIDIDTPPEIDEDDSSKIGEAIKNIKGITDIKDVKKYLDDIK